jgi:Rrf2 family protein
MLSVKSKYGVSAVFELAQLAGGSSMSIKELSDKASIPKKYLEQILNELKKDGILCSSRGASGGYQLAKNYCEITVYDIVKSLEHDIFLSSTYNGCGVLADFWKETDQQFALLLNSSLKTLCDRQKELSACLQFTI